MSAATPVSGRVHAVLVTFRRPEWLRTSLAAVQGQTRPPDTVTVVDNDPSPETRALVASIGATVDLSYLASSTNRGPAGGLADGVKHVLSHAADEDWILFLDDDDPPRDSTMLEQLVQCASCLTAGGTRFGAIGIAGSRLDRSTGRMVRPADAELHGLVPVDNIGNGQLPLYAVAALRAAGPPDERLFFGFEELELGLRLVSSGWPLFTHGDLHRESRVTTGRIGLEVKPSSRYTGPPGWRRYYSLRNQVWILRRSGLRHQAFAVAVAQGILKPLRNLPGQPRWAWAHLRLNLRAIRHAYGDVLGLTEPLG